jgi:DNA-binding PadR family transcriptional regulator
MLRDNLIIEVEAHPGNNIEKESRRYYQLTEIGRKTLSAEVDRLSSLMDTIREKAPFRNIDKLTKDQSGS